MNKNNKIYKGKIAFYHGYSWHHRIKEIRPDGTTKYGRLGGFKTPEEAEASYYIHLEKFEQSKRKNITKIVNKDILFTDYLKYWVEEIYKQKVRSSTFMGCSHAIYKLVIPNITYDIKLKLVSEEYLDELLKRIEPASKSAASESRSYLYLAFKDAVLDDYIKSNPVMNTKKYRQNKSNITILNKEEITKFLKIVSDGNWYLEILLALYAGLRKGEILGLKFSDFNYENKTVKIQRQIAYDYEMNQGTYTIESMSKVERDPKTQNSVRTIKLPDIIIKETIKRQEEINLVKTYNSNYIDFDYISAQKNGNPRSLGSLNLYLNRLCKRNGLRRITMHGLRHMFATILIENNVPLTKISAILGHTSIHTTFEFYLDVIDDKTKISAFMNNTYSIEEMRK